MIFRYPGSKAKLLPNLRPAIDALLQDRKVFHDVFVGGGSVALDVAARHPTVPLRLNDLDKRIYAFWQIAAGVQPGLNDLCERLEKTKPTVQMFKEVQSAPITSKVDAAFQGVFLNRCSFSGLLHGNPIGGWDQISKYTVACRYNGARVAQEIRETHQLLKGRTKVYNFDACRYIQCVPHEPKYLDPPYYHQGRHLYPCSMTAKDHALLALTLFTCTKWVLSYDQCVEIKALYAWANVDTLKVRYTADGKKTKWKKKKEYLICPGP